MQNEPLPILVADADAAQGRAISEWLKAWGRQVTLTQDGGQALGLLMHQPFAAVFLDIHLPIVGGIDATQALRATAPTAPRLPIIGLQNRADGLDNSRLIDAGMDAVLIKPFSPAELHAVLTQLLPVAEPAAAPPAPTLDNPDEGCLDPQKVEEFIVGDAELFDEMVELLIAEYPRRMTQIAAAIREQDGKALERAAHSLKGALSYFCRKFLLTALQTLERCGREMDFSAGSELQAKLEALQPQLERELEARRATSAQAATHGDHRTAPVSIAPGGRELTPIPAAPSLL